jgi:excisionase family DNA binding protein
VKRDGIDFEAFFAEPRAHPSELERARMRRVLEGVAKAGPHGGPGGDDSHADAVLFEVRAMRGEMALLIELSQAPANDQILTRKEAAELLKMCIESVTKAVRDDGLPCKRIGKEYRFLRSRVMAWLAARGPSDSGDE